MTEGKCGVDCNYRYYVARWCIHCTRRDLYKHMYIHVCAVCTHTCSNMKSWSQFQTHTHTHTHTHTLSLSLSLTLSLSLSLCHLPLHLSDITHVIPISAYYLRTCKNIVVFQNKVTHVFSNGNSSFEGRLVYFKNYELLTPAHFDWCEVTRFFLTWLSALI